MSNRKLRKAQTSDERLRFSFKENYSSISPAYGWQEGCLETFAQPEGDVSVSVHLLELQVAGYSIVIRPYV